MDWFGKVGLFTFIVGIWFIAGTSQQAYADTIFTDDFFDDPASNGWTETSSQFPVQGFSSTAIGRIVPATVQGTEARFEKTGLFSGIQLNIDRTIDTTGFSNIAFNVSAFQDSMGTYDALFGDPEPHNALRVEADYGLGFVLVFTDMQQWNGVEDTVGENAGSSVGGQLTNTATGLIPLSALADNNPNFKIRISWTTATLANDFLLDNFELTGDPIQQNNPDAFDLLEELYDLVSNLESDQIKNSGSLVSQAANLLEMLEDADKETHALFIEKFHEFKDLLKEKLGKGKQQGSIENKIMGNNLDKMELKLKMQSSKILEEANKNNKIQSAIDLSIQKKELIKIKNLLGVAQHLNKSPEKDKLIEQLELEKIELLKDVIILDAKHNDKKITTDFLKKLDEKITQEKVDKKSQNDKKQDDKSNNSKKTDNKSKGNSSQGKSKNK